MSDIPPPPEPAFSNWCAEQANPPALCFAPKDPPPLDFGDWGLLVVIAVLVAVLVAYLVLFSRQAYLGWRYVQACGGYRAAARHLAAIEADNEARLAGALSIHAFTNTKDTKK